MINDEYDRHDDSIISADFIRKLNRNSSLSCIGQQQQFVVEELNDEDNFDRSFWRRNQSKIIDLDDYRTLCLNRKVYWKCLFYLYIEENHIFYV